MATYTSLINSVLARLREDSISTPTETDYSTLIGELVNESKREVEDSWKWNVLRSTETITTAAGTSAYTITPSSGDMTRFKFQDPRLSVYDATNLSRLHKANSQWVKEQLLNDTNQGVPTYYYIEGINASNLPKIHFYSIPDGVYTVNLELVIPQDDFSAGGEILSVPAYPVILSAFAKAIAERGEDSGRTHGEAMAKAQQALLDAIQIDSSISDDIDWEVY